MLCVGNTLYFLESIHPYQVLDVGDTIPIPGGDCTSIPVVGCWLHNTYTRCWMLAILYMFLYQVLEITMRHYTHIPGVLYLWYTTEIYIPMVKLIYSVFATKQI